MQHDVDVYTSFCPTYRNASRNKSSVPSRNVHPTVPSVHGMGSVIKQYRYRRIYSANLGANVSLVGPTPKALRPETVRPRAAVADCTRTNVPVSLTFGATLE